MANDSVGWMNSSVWFSDTFPLPEGQIELVGRLLYLVFVVSGYPGLGP